MDTNPPTSMKTATEEIINLIKSQDDSPENVGRLITNAQFLYTRIGELDQKNLAGIELDQKSLDDLNAVFELVNSSLSNRILFLIFFSGGVGSFVKYLQERV